MEASLLSLGQIPENEAPRRAESSRGNSKASRSRKALANIFTKVVPGSITESTSEVPETVWTAKTNYAFDTRALFKRRITNLYISLASLRSYVELNYSRFRKILKK